MTRRDSHTESVYGGKKTAFRQRDSLLFDEISELRDEAEIEEMLSEDR